MSEIKKLITIEWIRFFLSAEFVLLLLLTIGNLISGLQRENVSNTEVLLNYLIELPSFINQVTPVSCLVASLFSINKLKNRNELTAIFASGFSRQAYIVCLVYISIFVTFFQFFVSGYLNPYIKSKRHIILSDSLDKFRKLQSQGLSTASGKIWYKNREYFFSFSKFDKNSNTIFNVDVYKYNAEYKLKEVLKFPLLKHDPNTNSWKFKDSYALKGLSELSFPQVSNKNVNFVLKEELSDFKQIEADITTLNFNNLFAYISKLNASGINTGEYFVIFLKHISDSVICIIFTLLAAVSIFNPNRRNSSFGKNAGFVFIFTILYWLVQNYTIELGKNLKLQPLLACFIVPLFFTLFIIYTFYKNRRIS